MVRLHQLEYFDAVVRERNFTRAAETMHVAQPSLSTQVRALERDLGAELFNRTRGNITLTAAGEVLLPLARRILADVDNARVQVQELLDLQRGRLRIGATPSLATVLLPPFSVGTPTRIRASSSRSRRRGRASSSTTSPMGRSTWPWSSSRCAPTLQ